MNLHTQENTNIFMFYILVFIALIELSLLYFYGKLVKPLIKLNKLK